MAFLFGILYLMLEINKRYVRFSPTKDDQSIVIIKTEQELNYHQDLEKGGYRYEEVKETKSPNTCTSCEG